MAYKISENQPWKINPKYGKGYMMKILIAVWFVVAKYFTQISTDGRMLKEIQFSSVQLLSRVQLFAIPWIAARQASLSITISRSSLSLTSI